MSQITGGRVLYGRTVKTGDYENKRVDVEFTFAVGDGEAPDEIANRAATMALTKAHELLGLKVTPPQAANTTTAPAASTTAGVKVETAGPQDPKAKAAKRGGKPPATAAAETTAQDAASIEGLDETGEKAPAAPAASASQSAPATAPGAGSSAANDDDIFSAAPSEVTDEALMSAITKKNAEIKDPPAIRALIGKYVEPPKQAREIEQSKRGAFLKELEALTKKAA